MKRLLTCILLFLSILPVSGKNKERVTERGSSLFYRSWRYPIVSDAKEDTMKVEKTPVDSVAVEDVVPQDSVPPIDSMSVDSMPVDSTPVDTIPQDALTERPSDSSENDPTPVAPSMPNISEDNPKVERPDINTCIVYFIFDQSNFIKDYKAEFDTIMAFIDYHKGKDFEVIGHTDERGTVAYNQGLSERRAKKVFDVLVGRGVDPKRMTTIGRSELELAIPHAKNEREHLLNRRVVVRVKE